MRTSFSYRVLLSLVVIVTLCQPASSGENEYSEHSVAVGPDGRIINRVRTRNYIIDTYEAPFSISLITETGLYLTSDYYTRTDKRVTINGKSSPFYEILIGPAPDYPVTVNQIGPSYNFDTLADFNQELIANDERPIALDYILGLSYKIEREKSEPAALENLSQVMRNFVESLSELTTVVYDQTLPVSEKPEEDYRFGDLSIEITPTGLIVLYHELASRRHERTNQGLTKTVKDTEKISMYLEDSVDLPRSPTDYIKGSSCSVGLIQKGSQN